MSGVGMESSGFESRCGNVGMPALATTQLSTFKNCGTQRKEKGVGGERRQRVRAMWRQRLSTIQGRLRTAVRVLPPPLPSSHARARESGDAP